MRTSYLLVHWNITTREVTSTLRHRWQGHVMRSTTASVQHEQPAGRHNNDFEVVLLLPAADCRPLNRHSVYGLALFWPIFYSKYDSITP